MLDEQVKRNKNRVSDVINLFERYFSGEESGHYTSVIILVQKLDFLGR